MESCLAATDEIELSGHGFETDDPLTVRATEGGTLSAPLAPNTIYYAIRITNGSLKLATMAGGDAIDLTTDGVSMAVLRDPPYTDVIAYYSRFVDGFMPGHVVPFAAAPNSPTEVKVLVAELSAKKLQNLDGKSSAIVDSAELAAKAQLERYSKGLPVREAVDQPRANLAITSAGSRDPRGWGPSGCLP